MNLLEVKLIFKIYGNGEVVVYVLKDICFFVLKGEFVVIVGEFGFGKSIFFNLVGVFDMFIFGKVFIDGKDIFFMKDSSLMIFWCRNIGFIF